MSQFAFNSLSDVDPRLLTEAFRRAQQSAGSASFDPDRVLSAIISAARHGARDMYSLVSAARAAYEPEAA